MGAALVLVVGLLDGCGIPVREGDCPGGDITPVTAVAASRPPAAVGALWVADGSGAVRRIDGRTGEATATVAVAGVDPRMVPALVAGGGRLWVYRFDTGAVALIDPARGVVAGRATVKPVTPLIDNRVLYAYGALWIVQPGRLWRITVDGKVSGTALPDGFQPWAAVATEHWLWLASGKRLLRVDPADPADVAELALPQSAGELSYAGGGLYVTGINSAVVHRLDPVTGAVVGQTRLRDDELALSLAGEWAMGNCGNVVRLTDGLSVRVSEVSQDLPSVMALGDLWVGDEIASEVVRIDGASGEVRARMPVAAADPDDPAFGLLAGKASVWVVDGGVSRVDAGRNQVARILAAPIGAGGAGLTVAAF
ncbi:hypothetical protein Ate02nite_33430 [Paractinoplanes tereljensis]|uniref:Uncharacterized protein n=1 Tax=Paractinoplanes tereljensis TaxID=571912 RepID=A0A919TRS3_9ACTN|nr:hypothetical protein Ate02nite_33430 [Actinoplanes tereljensis]